MSTAPNPPQAAPPAAADPRAEHDALAARLAVRRAVDEIRKALYQIFAGLVGVGLSVKLAWDRWGVLKPGVVRKAHTGPPLFLWVATAATAVLLVLAIRSFLRARRQLREEDALYARYRHLRDALGLEP